MELQGITIQEPDDDDGEEMTLETFGALRAKTENESGKDEQEKGDEKVAEGETITLETFGLPAVVVEAPTKSEEVKGEAEIAEKKTGETAEGEPKEKGDQKDGGDSVTGELKQETKAQETPAQDKKAQETKAQETKEQGQGSESTGDDIATIQKESIDGTTAEGGAEKITITAQPKNDLETVKPKESGAIQDTKTQSKASIYQGCNMPALMQSWVVQVGHYLMSLL